MKNKDESQKQWTAAELEEAKNAWDAVVEILKNSPDVFMKLEQMILEMGADNVIASTVESSKIPEEVKEIYRKAVRFRYYDMGQPEPLWPWKSRPGVTECFAAPKPTTKPW